MHTVGHGGLDRGSPAGLVKSGSGHQRLGVSRGIHIHSRRLAGWWALAAGVPLRGR